MAGIYFHIPFCKQACSYCNFHFSTSLKQKDAMIIAILNEIALQKDYLSGEEIDSIYFGGGTPSLLNADEINTLIDRLADFHTIRTTAEITLEANPDDLDQIKLKELAHTPVNRLSIGIQSFSEPDLRFMNRAHSATEAKGCLKLVRDIGFANISIDLIYGVPSSDTGIWEDNLDYFLRMEIPHLSAYCLTVEPNTALFHFIKQGKTRPVDDSIAAEQFEILMDRLHSFGYQHYEISNFSKTGFLAVHNSNYWKGVKYLGLGPSAHSFDGSTRQWNIRHNSRYIQALQSGRLLYEKEILQLTDKYNEYIMMGIRTMWGCDIERIKTWGSSYHQHFLTNVLPFLRNQSIQCRGGNYTLTRKGKLLADHIAMQLFI